MNIGIDLGTTFSLTAFIGSGLKEPALIPDKRDKAIYTTPSLLYFQNNSVLVGSLAEDYLEYYLSRNSEKEQHSALGNRLANAANFIRSFKRYLGKTEILEKIHNVNWTPEMIAALVLRKLKDDALSYTGQKEIENAVIGVPANFSYPQRRSVLAAAALAEIPNVVLENEPELAALYYGVANQKQDEINLVYDLGGGTFDATIMTLQDNKVHVIATDGDTKLGGIDFDEKIMNFILERFDLELGELSTRAKLDLRRKAHEFKIQLAVNFVKEDTQILILDDHAGEITLTQREFHRIVEPDIEKAELILLNCIREAGLDKSNIDNVLLVGGGSMIDLIKQRIEKIFDGNHQKIIHKQPIYAVAYGAALRCAQIAGKAEAFNIPEEFRGVSAYNLGIKIYDPQAKEEKIDTLIQRNFPLPITEEKIYYTLEDNQHRLRIELVQFRNEESIALPPLFIYLPPNTERNSPIRVKLEYLVDGTINIEARDEKSGKQIKNSYSRLEDQDIVRFAEHWNLVRTIPINDIDARNDRPLGRL